MKKFSLFLIISFIAISVSAQKLWLSGYYSQSTLEYLENAKSVKTPAVWMGGIPKNDANVVVYGEFQTDSKGKSYFFIEKSHESVALKSGPFERITYNCPIGSEEGKIMTSGKGEEYVSFIPLGEKGNISVTRAAWGIKTCNGNTYNVYYIFDGKITKEGVQQEKKKTTNSPIDKSLDRVQDELKKKSENKSTGSINNTGSSVSKKEAEEALAYHNKARRDVGVGALSWSVELSQYAQEWADYLARNNCTFEHRSTLGKNSKNYGENLFWGNGTVYTSLDASKSWYNEIKDFKNVPLNSSNWRIAGHYTQMVWKNTKEVGMGVARCSNGSYIIVANYNPPGNYLGQKAY